MRLKFDKESDALYFRLDETLVVESEQVQPDVILGFDAAGQVIGVEILNVSKRVPAQQLRTLQFETA